MLYPTLEYIKYITPVWQASFNPIIIMRIERKLDVMSMWLIQFIFRYYTHGVKKKRWIIILHLYMQLSMYEEDGKNMLGDHEIVWEDLHVFLLAENWFFYFQDFIDLISRIGWLTWKCTNKLSFRFSYPVKHLHILNKSDFIIIHIFREANLMIYEPTHCI